MRKKKTFYSELAYLLGILILALGSALMARADFGMSMVVAPAYLLHLKISQFFPAFSFGMAEYCLQAVLLAVLSVIIRKFKPVFLFSFVTAVLYGVLLDAMIRLVGVLPSGAVPGRVLFYLSGVICCSAGVSLLFHTYLAPEAYELFVKEISTRYGKNVTRTKTVYDCCSCLLALMLSFLFFGFGHFEGVKLGTALCALCNGTLIGLCSRALESVFVFQDAWQLRHLFE